MINETGVEHKWVEGFEGLYSVTKDGRVYSHSRLVPFKNTKRLVKGRWLKATTDSQGYPRVDLRKDNKTHPNYVHRLVAIAFIPNETGLPIINHKDEDKTNNNVDNLEWCDNQYNISYSVGKKITLEKDGVKATANSVRKLCRDLDLKRSNVRKLLKGEFTSEDSWSVVDESVSWEDLS